MKKTHIITPVYNEEVLLPIFIYNYKWADKITFLFDSDSTDSSSDTILRLKHKSKNKYDIKEVKYENGFDDEKLIKITNEIIKSDKHSDYFICVDADEFIIDTPDFSNNPDYIFCNFYQMHRQPFEPRYITFNKPLVQQRSYGVVNDMYLKPCIVKASTNPIFGVGKHTVLINYKMIVPSHCEKDNFLKGMHLNEINLNFALDRKKERYNRMSENNKKNGYGKQYFEYDEVDIAEQYNKVHAQKVF